jgi:hypothetical protein
MMMIMMFALKSVGSMAVVATRRKFNNKYLSLLCIDVDCFFFFCFVVSSWFTVNVCICSLIASTPLLPPSQAEANFGGALSFRFRCCDSRSSSFRCVCIFVLFRFSCSIDRRFGAFRFHSIQFCLVSSEDEQSVASPPLVNKSMVSKTHLSLHFAFYVKNKIKNKNEQKGVDERSACVAAARSVTPFGKATIFFFFFASNFVIYFSF